MRIETLIEKVKLPSPAELQPWLAKLLDNPDSLVIISIEKPLLITGPHVAWTWLSLKERLKVRQALTAINQSRAKKDQPQTTETPA